MILLHCIFLLCYFCVYILFYSLTGVGTKIDPTLCRADRLVGQVLGAVGALPEIYIELEISYFLLRRLLGVRTEGDKKAAKVISGNLNCYGLYGYVLVPLPGPQPLYTMFVVSAINQS